MHKRKEEKWQEKWRQLQPRSQEIYSLIVRRTRQIERGKWPFQRTLNWGTRWRKAAFRAEAGLQQISTQIYCFKDQLKLPLRCFTQSIRLNLVGISPGKGIKVQAMLTSSEAFLATWRSARENYVVVHICV